MCLNTVFEFSLTHTMLPKGYGFPKVHKLKVPLRIVIHLVNIIFDTRIKNKKCLGGNLQNSALFMLYG